MRNARSGSSDGDAADGAQPHRIDCYSPVTSVTSGMVRAAGGAMLHVMLQWRWAVEFSAEQLLRDWL